MNLITSCPACGTMFRVVPDQLKISEGWVRCGHCAEIFDATAQLVQDDPASPPVEDEQVTQPIDLSEQEEHWDQRPAPPSWRPRFPPNADKDAVIPSWPALDESGAAAQYHLPHPVAAPASAAASPQAAAGGAPESEILEESALDVPFVFRRSDILDSEPAPSLPPYTPSRPAELRAATLPPPDEDAELESVSFVRQARRRAYWRRPTVRILLSLLGLLLAAALLLQMAYHDRDRLAAAQPGLQPALLQMCEVLACTLEAPRQIDAIVIENSAFNRLRSDAYRLSFTLRNASPLQVAAPSIELTLTDTQDQPVLRRVLSPAELGSAGGVIPAASDWAGTVGIVVSATGAARIAGYRLLAFYP